MNSEAYMTPGGVLSSLTGGLSGIALAMQRRREQDSQDARFAAQDELARSAQALQEAHMRTGEQHAADSLQLERDRFTNQQGLTQAQIGNLNADNTRADAASKLSAATSQQGILDNQVRNAHDYGYLPQPVPLNPSQQMVGRGIGALMGDGAQQQWGNVAGQRDPGLAAAYMDGQTNRAARQADRLTYEHETPDQRRQREADNIDHRGELAADAADQKAAARQYEMDVKDYTKAKDIWDRGVRTAVAKGTDQMTWYPGAGNSADHVATEVKAFKDANPEPIKPVKPNGYVSATQATPTTGTPVGNSGWTVNVRQ